MPLHVASRFGYYDRIVESSLESGADVNAKDNDGLTTLHYFTSAPSSAQEEVIVNIMKALLAAGSDVRAKNRGGWTPLYWAAEDNRSIGPFAGGRRRCERYE